MNEPPRVQLWPSSSRERRLSNTAGLVLATGVGAALWVGLVEGAHLLGAF